MIKLTYISYVIIIFFFLSAGCEHKETRGLSPAAEELVDGHTGGLISTESLIRVQFTRDIADSTLIDEILDENPFLIKPAIDGYAFWGSPRTLVFRPENRLPGGADFHVQLDLQDIKPDLYAGDILDFSFSTIRQTMEISVSGLSYIDPADLSVQRLQGELVTADVADGNLVSQILKANQEGRELKIEWEHNQDRRNHKFTVSGIERKSSASNLAISWDGNPIEVDQKGERTILITPLNEFELIDTRAVRDETDYIELRFSDPLLVNQRLEGLIEIKNVERPGFEIDQNVIRVFSTKSLDGNVDITITPGIRNSMGYRFGKHLQRTVTFTEIKPQVRFVGQGAIMPTRLNNTLPFEAVNLKSIIVEAIRIYEDNILQFLQVNSLEGEREIKRVARPVWKKTIELDLTPDRRNRWTRYGLDLTPLYTAYPSGLFRLRIYFSPEHIDYKCDSLPVHLPPERPENWEAQADYEYWDEFDDEGFNWYEYYQQRFNPCHPAYYRSYYDHDIKVERNVLISDVGLIAKHGTGPDLFVAVNNISSASPMVNTKVSVFNYQQQEIASGFTGENGVVTLKVEQKPFLVTARSETQMGYLKLDEASSQPVGHFDVGGESVKQSIKGLFYGERGVWRPGDTMYITFILHDPSKILPPDHPVVFHLLNARGQLVKTIKRSTALNGFYTLELKTDPADPTGNWQIRAIVGANVFNKDLRVESIIPNRLKIGLDFGEIDHGLKAGAIEGVLSANWLHGAIARNLDADIELTLVSTKTYFAAYDAFSFDDPVRRFEPERLTLFKGQLDASGKARFSKNLSLQRNAPGMLKAAFQTRVFEKSGAFSTDRYTIDLHPYETYVGLHVPGSEENQLLVTDTTHRVDIVAVNDKGARKSSARVELRLYKIKWRWWWEKGSDALADYIGSEHFQPIAQDTLDLPDGRTSWMFKIAYPEWGRYLVQARDLEGGHSTGVIFYVDWPGWARKARREDPGGATVLNVSADKDAYQVGEEIEISIPTAARGRGLVSIESGSRILKSDWISGNAETLRYRFRASSEMAPNIYVHVTYIQPAGQTDNDLPVRLYGIIPVSVYDPGTTLKPVIETRKIFTPDQSEIIKVSENNGRAMTYTVAVVDEGLLDLTRFKTPDPWNYFYRREALGVRTWDLYDQVIGAFGGRYERLLSIGGGEEIQEETGRQAQRFPPMVRFIGPFYLDKQSKNEHTIDIPQYIGSVRIMVVAGQGRAYGFEDKTLPVRKPLMILSTLPRVLGTGEQTQLPVSVFSMDENIKNVNVRLEVTGPLKIDGPARQSLAFEQTGDRLIFFMLHTSEYPGIARLNLIAESGAHLAKQTIEIDVRSVSVPVTEVRSAKIEAGRLWTGKLDLPGQRGTNKVWLEVSRIPPLDLSRRLRYLINYPHGCIEQTVSGAFPQIFLPKLAGLSADEKRQTSDNVRSAIDRIQRLQSPDGGFQYWPGAASSDDWSTSYTGHFLLEAENAGFSVPQAMKDNWHRFQTNRSRSWTTGTEKSMLMQAYRLFTLALAGKPELGAMNRLREARNLSIVGKWTLAAAYKLSGFEDASSELIRDAGTTIPVYREMAGTYGSDIRDRAMILGAMTILGLHERARTLAEKISEEICSDQWLSTQTIAHSLIALAHFSGLAGPAQATNVQFGWQRNAVEEISFDLPVLRKMLPVKDKQSEFTLRNLSEATLYTRFVMEGTPAVGEEKSAANGLAIEIQYHDPQGKPLDLKKISQGSDLVILISVRNTGNTGPYRELALSHLMPSGWEIRNPRMELVPVIKESEYDYRDYRDDRVYTYFDLNSKTEKTFRIFVNNAYAGEYYLPMIGVEAMYDATIFARQSGRWISIYRPDEKE